MRFKRVDPCYRILVPVAVLATLLLVVSLHLGAIPSDESLQHHQESSILSEEQVRRMIREAKSANTERQLHIQKVCRMYNLGLYKDSSAPPIFKHPPTPQYGVFYIDLVHKLSWCPIYKAASSTWLYNLCLLGGYTESQLTDRTQQLSTLARKVYPELEYPQAEEALQSTLKLLVVRHPFERILSAYRDKLENSRVGGEHGTAHFYRSYGARIVAKYRPGGNETKVKDILQPGTFYWDSNKPEPAGVEPTFKEFVRYLIDLDLINYADDHWIPIYLFCTPCLLNYDIVAKVETLQRDQIYAIRAANIDHLIKPKWQHRTVPGGKTASDIARIYFSQLSQIEVEKLYQKYQLDFELFGYDFSDYLKYTKESQPHLL